MKISAVQTAAESVTKHDEIVVASKQKNWKFTTLALVICFATGLLLCWRSNFSHAALEVAPMFDSGKYISSTEQVMNATTFIHHFTQQEWKTICSMLKAPLMLDGPILPLLGAAWFTLIHKSPDLFDMRAALALQAILHGLSACVMYVTARRILRNDKWSLLTGLLWAAYPSAVLGTGRFMTENITSTLLLLTACIVPARVTDKYVRSFALGVIAALVGLLKAPLLPGLLLGFLLVGFSLWTNDAKTPKATAKGLMLHAIATAFGAMLIFTPWLLFTKEATGAYSLTAQREPVFNIVIGGNSETDGWSGNPETDFLKLFDTVNGDKAGTFLGIWQANLPELSNLAIRRVPRLWSSPWNDCLSKFIGLTLPIQWLWHQLILTSAIFGILLIAFKKKESSDRNISAILSLSAALIAGHLIYIVFIAGPRQAFSSMPFLVLLASYSLLRIVKSPRWKLVLTTTSGSLLLWLAAVSFDFHSILQTLHGESFAYLASWLVYAIAAALCSYAVVLINGNKNSFVPSLFLQLIPGAIICTAMATTAKTVPEWQCDLRPNASINRTVTLNPDLKPEWAVVAVDGDFGLTKATVEVNGQKLAEPLGPIFTFTSNKDLMINYAVFSGVTSKVAEQLRQWRAIVVPLALLKPTENKITITATDGGATVYGSFIRTENGKLIAPTMSGFSAGKLLSETQPKLEARYNEPLTASATKGKCWLTDKHGNSTDDLSPSLGVQTGQYRAFLCLGFPQAKRDMALQESQQQVTLESTPITISEQQPFSRKYPVPKTLGKSTFVNVEVSGEFAEDGIQALSRVDVRNFTHMGADLILPNSVQQIQRKKFDFAGSLTRASLDQENEFFEIKFQSKPPIHLTKLSLKVTPCERPDFAKAKVAVY
ncbi:MAG: hypothetical protein JST89_11120 [Cyanobacteria bacterium SZAS-4]|nr:hypothetical protein [Cyanobacteria bacterium SZAS-4]